MSNPKQVARFFGDLSMLQLMAHRLLGLDFATPTVINRSEYRFIVAEQLAQIKIVAKAI